MWKCSVGSGLCVTFESNCMCSVPSYLVTNLHSHQWLLHCASLQQCMWIHMPCTPVLLEYPTRNVIQHFTDIATCLLVSRTVKMHPCRLCQTLSTAQIALMRQHGCKNNKKNLVPNDRPIVPSTVKKSVASPFLHQWNVERSFKWNRLIQSYM